MELPKVEISRLSYAEQIERLHNVSFFTKCFHNASINDTIIFLERLERIQHVYRRYYCYLPLPFTAAALALTVAFAIAVTSAIKYHRVNPNFYLLLLNRAIGDILCCLSSVISIIYIFCAPHLWSVSIDAVRVLEAFFISCLWSGMISYVGISLMKLYAVWKPFDFQTTVTRRRCVLLIIVSWVLFAIMVVYSIALILLTKVPSLSQWSHCQAETCIKILYRSRMFFTAFTYFITLTVFALTLVYLRKYTGSFTFNGRPSRWSRQSRAPFPFWKLSLHVTTFACFNGPLTAFGVFIFFQERCFFQHHFEQMYRLLAYIRCALLMRILFDSIISFVTDFQIRLSAKLWLGLRRRVTSSSTRTFGVSGTNDDGWWEPRRGGGRLHITIVS